MQKKNPKPKYPNGIGEGVGVPNLWGPYRLQPAFGANVEIFSEIPETEEKERIF